MDFRQLETFLKVAELKSFSKAAQTIFRTQPTISDHIRSLEKELNTRLFLRTRQESILTPAGKRFLKHAKRMLTQREQSLLEMSRFSDTVKGDLIIGASSIPGEYILPDMIGRFLEHFPEIKVTLNISDSKKAIDWVLERKSEIAFVGTNPKHKLLEEIPFASDRIVPVINTAHPLSTKPGLTLKDLQQVPLILREQGSGTRKAVESVLNSKGLSWKYFKVAIVLGSTTSVLNTILSGPFLSFLSTKSVAGLQDHSSLLKIIEVSDFQPIQREFFMIKNKKGPVSPMARHFISSTLNESAWPDTA